jgi:hypothetical protein
MGARLCLLLRIHTQQVYYLKDKHLMPINVFVICLVPKIEEEFHQKHKIIKKKLKKKILLINSCFIIVLIQVKELGEIYRRNLKLE